MQPTDDTLRLVWEGVLDADRLARYYGYLTVRLRRLGRGLGASVVGLHLAAALTMAGPFPAWVPAAAMAAGAAAVVAYTCGRFEELAARAVGLHAGMERLSVDWQLLWSDARARDDAELREAWRELSLRQKELLARTPLEVPLAQGLAERCQREACEYWTARHASA